MSDARFEDGDDAPLGLAAQDANSLAVMSALLQDAVFPITEMRFAKPRRRFAMMLNRFRWEDRTAALASGRRYERVQSLLVFHDVLGVQTSDIDRADTDTILSLMQITFEPGPDGTGRALLILSGDGSIALTLESLDVQLRDVTRPYLAPSGKMPDHGH